MKIYTRVVLDMATGKIEEEDSYEYSGPVAQCGKDSAPSSAPPPTSQTVTQTNMPAEAAPYYISMLNRAQDVSQNPYPAYPGQLVAGTSPLQQQALDTGTGLANNEMAQSATGMGNMGLGSIYAQQAGQGAFGVGNNAMAQQGSLFGQGQGYLNSGSNMVGSGQGTMQNAAQGAMGLGANALNTQNAMYNAGAGLIGAGSNIVGSGLGQAANGLGQSAGGAGMMGQAGMGALGVGQNAMGLASIYNPNNVQSWMNPYQQGVTDIAKQQANVQFANQQNAAEANAASHGAFGGYRDQLRASQDQFNQNTLLNNIQMQGGQQAYNAALAAMGQQAQTGLAAGSLGLAGYGQAANAGQGIGQLGLGAGNLGLGMGQLGIGQQGVGTNLQGQSINAGQLGLAGYGQAGNLGQGIGQLGLGQQGVGTNLYGQALNAGQLGLAGFGQAGTQGQNLANIGGQQVNVGNQGLSNMQTLGALQQTNQQNQLSAAYNQYQNASSYPQQQLNFLSGILRGVPASPTTDTTMYQAPPSVYSQLAGIGMAGAGLGSLASKIG